MIQVKEKETLFKLTWCVICPNNELVKCSVSFIRVQCDNEIISLDPAPATVSS